MKQDRDARPNTTPSPPESEPACACRMRPSPTQSFKELRNRVGTYNITLAYTRIAYKSCIQGRLQNM